MKLDRKVLLIEPRDQPYLICLRTKHYQGSGAVRIVAEISLKNQTLSGATVKNRKTEPT